MSKEDTSADHSKNMGIFEHKPTKIKITDLVWDSENPNRMNQEQMHGLRKAMERFGYLSPVIVDQHNKIADGEHRALVYKEFNMTEIPAYRVNLADDTERRLLRQTMNKLRGQHDFKMDAEEMAIIYEANKLPDLSGLIAQEERTLKELMLKYKPDLPFGHEDDEQLDQLIDEQLKKTAPDTQLGDIYQLGNHRLICADFTDSKSIDRLLENNSINLILTDPPYDADHLDIYQDLAKLAAKTLAPGASIITYLRQYDIPTIIDYMQDAGLSYHWLLAIKLAGPFPRAFDKGVVIKQKPLLWFTMGKRQPSSNDHIADLIESETTTQVKALHEWAQSPSESMQIISRLTSKNEIIFDPMLGSGTSLIACESTQRVCFGCEIDPHYVDICVKRWEAYTGHKQKAQLLRHVEA